MTNAANTEFHEITSQTDTIKHMGDALGYTAVLQPSNDSSSSATIDGILSKSILRRTIFFMSKKTPTNKFC